MITGSANRLSVGCRASRYNHARMISDGRFLLFNLATSAIALLDTEELSEIETASFGDAQRAATALDNGFIVPAEENELEKVLAIQRMNNYSTRFAGFQILPTTSCNARCFYCYEQGYQRISMSDEVERAIPSFIASFMDMVDDVHVTWFGGEPLLGWDSIQRLSAELIGQAKRRGVGYTSDIVTNATLLSAERARELVEACKVTQAQVTFDGLREQHMQRKRYRDESIDFDDILKALEYLVRAGSRLLIRLNVDKDNLDDCLSLIDMLGGRYAGNENVMLYVAPLYGSVSPNANFEKLELTDAYRRIFMRMIDAGFIQTLDGLPMNFNNATCSARMVNNYVIDPRGDVYKCEHLLSQESEKLGTVFDGVVFNEAMVRWASPSLPKTCMECSFLPGCQGGCYAAEALDFGFARCPHIAFISDAVFDAAGYLIQKEKGDVV